MANSVQHQRIEINVNGVCVQFIETQHLAEAFPTDREKIDFIAQLTTTAANQLATVVHGIGTDAGLTEEEQAGVVEAFNRAVITSNDVW